MIADPLGLYKALGLKPEATAEQIDSTYRRKARALHPDKNPGDEEAATRFKALAEAYEVLSDPTRREHYDRTGKVLKASYGSEEGRSEELSRLSGFFRQAFSKIVGQGRDPIKTDLKREILQIISHTTSMILDQINGLVKDRDLLTALAARWKTTSGKESFIKRFCEVPIEQLERDIKTGQAEVDLLQRCATMLVDEVQTFDHDTWGGPGSTKTYLSVATNYQWKLNPRAG